MALTPALKATRPIHPPRQSHTWPVSLCITARALSRLCMSVHAKLIRVTPPRLVLPKSQCPTVLMAVPRASTETSGKAALRKTEEIKPTSQDQISNPQDSLPAVTAADRWIPPALLAAWRRGKQPTKDFACRYTSSLLVYFRSDLYLGRGPHRKLLAPVCAGRILRSSPLHVRQLRAPAPILLRLFRYLRLRLRARLLNHKRINLPCLTDLQRLFWDTNLKNLNQTPTSRSRSTRIMSVCRCGPPRAADTITAPTIHTT